MTQNELSEAGHNLLNDVQKIVGSKNIPQPTSDDLDKIATREWKLGYQYANWEWREKVPDRTKFTEWVKEVEFESAERYGAVNTYNWILEEMGLIGYSDTEPKSPDNGWIPVSERLPEKGKCVQIWREGLSIIPTNAYLYEYWINNTGLILNDVTHWRLLPMPPKSVKP